MTVINEQKEEPMTYEQIREMFQEIGRKQEETDRIIKEIQAEMAREREERSRDFDWQLDDMANSDGDASDLWSEHFVTSLASKMTFAGQHYDGIDFKVKRKGRDLQGEFDIVLFNGTAVAIIDVKDKASQKDLEELVTKKLPTFRTLFPQYKNHAVYLGIGSMSYADDRVLKKADELGIGILRQKGDTIENDTSHVRAY